MAWVKGKAPSSLLHCTRSAVACRAVGVQTFGQAHALVPGQSACRAVPQWAGGRSGGGRPRQTGYVPLEAKGAAATRHQSTLRHDSWGKPAHVFVVGLLEAEVEIVRCTDNTGYTLFVFGMHTGHTLWHLGIYMWDRKTMKKGKRNEILAIHCFIVSGEEPPGNEGLGN